jgi:hypothetical protein
MPAAAPERYASVACIVAWLSVALPILADPVRLPDSAELSAVFGLKMQKFAYREVHSGAEVSTWTQRMDRWTNGLYPYISSADLNEDGIPDIFIICQGFANELYLSNGQYLDYTAVTDADTQYGVLVSSTLDSRDAVFADFNGDSRDDIFIANGWNNDVDDYNELYLSQDGGGFVVASSGGLFGPILELAKESVSAVANDFNADGRTDLLVITNADASFCENELYYAVEGGGFERQQSGLPLTSLEVSWRKPKKVLVADFNRDGRGDVFVAMHPSTPSVLVLTDSGAASGFRAVDESDPEYMLTGEGLTTQHTMLDALSADWNSDGLADLFLATNGPNRLYLSNSDAGSGFQLATGPIVDQNIENRGISTADFNNDGLSPCLPIRTLTFDSLWRV